MTQLRTFALVATLVSISELQSLVDPCGCSAGHRSPEQTWTQRRQRIKDLNDIKGQF